MAETPRFVCVFLLILSVVLSSSSPALAGRGIPKDKSKNVDKKQPQFLLGHDGTVLIPGFGRVVIPPKGKKVNPFNYNPITGRSGGGTGAINPFDGIIGGGITGPLFPGRGSTGGGSSYVPGGDDTLVPNPGVEVPNPVAGAGGSLPAPPSRH